VTETALVVPDPAYIHTVMLALCQRRTKALANGGRLRAEMHRELTEKGESSGYRARWILDSANDMVSHLSNKIARRFNAKHRDDRASLQDMLDILSTASNIIKKKSNG